MKIGTGEDINAEVLHLPRDHSPAILGIICRPGSFDGHFGDHTLAGRDHLRAGIICGPGSFAGRDHLRACVTGYVSKLHWTLFTPLQTDTQIRTHTKHEGAQLCRRTTLFILLTVKHWPAMVLLISLGGKCFPPHNQRLTPTPSVFSLSAWDQGEDSNPGHNKLADAIQRALFNTFTRRLWVSSFQWWLNPPPPSPGEDSHMKRTRMLVGNFCFDPKEVLRRAWFMLSRPLKGIKTGGIRVGNARFGTASILSRNFPSLAPWPLRGIEPCQHQNVTFWSLAS